MATELSGMSLLEIYDDIICRRSIFEWGMLESSPDAIRAELERRSKYDALIRDVVGAIIDHEKNLNAAKAEVAKLRAEGVTDVARLTNAPSWKQLEQSRSHMNEMRANLIMFIDDEAMKLAYPEALKT